MAKLENSLIPLCLVVTGGDSPGVYARDCSADTDESNYKCTTKEFEGKVGTLWYILFDCLPHSDDTQVYLPRGRV